MTIFGASKECVDKMYSIFATNEIDVRKGEEDLFDIIIPATNNFSFQYDSLAKDVFFRSCSEGLGKTGSVLISTDHFFRLSLT